MIHWLVDNVPFFLSGAFVSFVAYSIGYRHGVVDLQDKVKRDMERE